MYWLEFSRGADFDVLVLSLLLLLLLHHAVAVLHHCLLHSPLNTDKASVRSFLHPSLLERSQQGLVVNALRTRGCEPLRSASRLLGFTIDRYFWDPGYGLVASLSPGLRPLQDPIYTTAPGSFLGWYLGGIDPHRVPIAIRLLCLVTTFPRASVDTKVAAGVVQEDSLVDRSAGNLHTPVSATLVELLLRIEGGREKETHVDTPKRFAPYSGATHPASSPFP